MSDADLTVSVIICCYTHQRLRQTLRAVEGAQTQVPPPTEVIVCVDHNPELLSELSSRLSNETIFVENQGTVGLSDARNSAVRRASGDILVFLDDDAAPADGWLTALIAPFDEHEVMGVGGSIDPQWETRCPKWFSAELGWVFGCDYDGMRRDGHIRNPIGCNMAVRRDPFARGLSFPSTIRRVGENAAAGGETEFFLRISEAFPDSRFAFAVDAKVHHWVPSDRCTLRYLLRRSWQEGVGKARIAARGRNGTQRLGSEQRYLRHLVLRTLPTKFTRMVGNPRELARMAVISASTVMVGAAFLLTRLSNPRAEAQ